MAEVLVIRLDERAPAAAEWILVDSQGARLAPPVTGPLESARIDVGGRRVIVLVPSSDVLTTYANIPLKSPAKIQQALPFALEESVAEDVENLHFAAGKRRDDGEIPVAVVNREKLEGWLDLLADAAIEPDALIPENHGLANIPGTISLIVTGEQVLINDGDKTELALHGVSPAEAMAAIGAYDTDDDADSGEDGSGDGLPRHVLVYCEAGSEETYKHDLIALRHDFESLDVKLLPDGLLPRLAVTVAAGTGVNLLQGEFGAKTEYGSYFQPWRYAAALLLVLGVVAVLSKSLSYFQLSQRESELRVQFMEQYRQIVPGAQDVADPVAAVDSLRRRGPGQSSAPPVFLQSLEQLSAALGANDEASVQAISYRAGVVDVRMSAPNVSVLNDVEQLVDEGGAFEAEIQSTDQDDERVNSRIQIKAAGQ